MLKMYMVCSQQSSGGFLWSLPLFLLWWLTQEHPGATAVLVDELDAIGDFCFYSYQLTNKKGAI
jgi:hypothetical protein